MKGLGLENLAAPDASHRIDRRNPQAADAAIETLAQARAQDEINGAGLEKLARNSADPNQRASAADLARRIRDGDDGGGPLMSQACSVYKRDVRKRVCGHLWKLADDPRSGVPSTFTVIGRGLEIPGADLWKVDPRKLTSMLRSDLNRGSASGASGYVIAFLDGEYEPRTDVIKLHWHGLAAGGMKSVLDRLRDRPKYRTRRSPREDADARCLQRVQISRKPLTNMPAPITYLLKPFWSSRWEGPIDGTMRRQNGRSRISEPRHSELLIWLDRWSLSDMTLMMGLRATSNGFQLNRHEPYTNSGT